MLKRVFLTFVAGVALGLGPLNVGAGETISLGGKWHFRLDPSDAGLQANWAATALAGNVKMPADLAEQGIGDRPSAETKWVGGVQHDWTKDPALAKYATPENFKFPYWLTPEHRYMGAAWFQREVEIPAEWASQRVVLFLERPHWETRVWVDARLIGTNNALGTPHEYDLGRLPAGKHTLTIRVDNRLVVDVGINSHSVSDHTQGNWNGIVGRIELRSTPPVWIEDLQVYPDMAAKALRLKGRIGNITGQPGTGTLGFGVFDARTRQARVAHDQIQVQWTENGGQFEAVARPRGELQAWDEFNPHLYEILTELGTNRKLVTTGFRELSTSGTQFLLNGHKIFFRGTLECAIFPKTGHPPTDVESWKHVLKAARAHGLNQLRFHSWCPPEAAFIAADEMGFYLHVECSSWANQSTTIGDGKPIDTWIYAEADRMLHYYGNHPSFMLMPYGNEPGGPNHVRFLAKWVEHYKSKDPRRLYTSGAGWPQIPENQFHVVPDPRVQAWGGGLKSRINGAPPETTTDYREYIRARSVPVISHEIGQWCVYPNFDEIPKYSGYLKPRNFEIFKESLDANHMGKLAHRFLLASGKLQTLCYKEDIESALRTPGMGGFQLLDLHDFPGQGTALVGVLDPFWESKGYVTPAEYNRFCNAVVPLARLPKRVFTTDEALHAAIEVANFGAAPLVGVRAGWKLTGTDGKIWAQGELQPCDLPVDNGLGLGEISAELKRVPAPAQGKLTVALKGTRYENDWDIWVYPPAKDVAIDPQITIVDSLDDDAAAKLNGGGKVLLLIPSSRVRPDPKRGNVAVGFSSIFWNTAWTGGQPPHTLGILCDPKHPLFRNFPTEYHSNWQWWYLVHRAGAMILDGLPAELQPQVQAIDDWVTNRRLALLFEAKVGAGKLVACSIDLQNEMEGDPVRLQFRRSLLAYMAGKQFSPRVDLSIEEVRGLVAPPNATQRMGARVLRASSSEPGYGEENVLDGNPNTMWHTRYSGGAADFPHELVLELPREVSIRGFTALPRQDGNRNGLIKDYAVYLSADGTSWGEPVAKGRFSSDSDLKQVLFEQPRPCRFFKMVVLSGYAKGPWASLAEIGLLPEK